MHPGFVAFASGGLLYITSAAMSSLQVSGEIRGLAWLGVAAVAFCHAALGFLAIGDRAEASRSPQTLFICGAASILMTTLVFAAAITAVSLFPLALSPNAALVLVALSVLASAVALILTAGRAWRGPNRQGE